MRFKATILPSGKTATGIEVPVAVLDGLGGGKRPAVNVSINDYAYRSTIASMGGVFMLPISAEHRAGAGFEAGDEVRVELTLDTEERTVAVPARAAFRGPIRVRELGRLPRVNPRPVKTDPRRLRPLTR